MRLASILLFALATKLFSAAPDDSLDIRQQELALATALQNKDRASLTALIADKFSFHLACSSPEKNYTAEFSRQEWMDDLLGLRLTSYRADISKIALMHSASSSSQPKAPAPTTAALATLNESLRSPDADPPLRHFRTQDTWLKVQGSWKLVLRMSQSDAPNCNAAPHMAWPNR